MIPSVAVVPSAVVVPSAAVALSAPSATVVATVVPLVVALLYRSVEVACLPYSLVAHILAQMQAARRQAEEIGRPAYSYLRY